MKKDMQRAESSAFATLQAELLASRREVRDMEMKMAQMPISTDSTDDQHFVII